MTPALIIDTIGPMASLQDLGRTGLTSVGLSPGGAMDPLALAEAAALLGLSAPQTAIEMALRGGTFRTTAPLRFALTGAPMAAQIDGRALVWPASHILNPGEVLTIGAATQGTFGYLTPAPQILTPRWQDSHAAHLTVRVGALLNPGDQLPLGPDPTPDSPSLTLPPGDRFSGGTLRLMPGPQTKLFDAATRDRLTNTAFTRSPMASRQGTRLDHEGAPFATPHAAGLISDFITCGDVQMTGAGTPTLLMAECQTIGGYPRIGTVIAADRPRAAQAPPGAILRFSWVDMTTADRLYAPAAALLDALRRQTQPLRRNPADNPNLLTLQLISGVTRGDDPKDNV